MLISGWGGYPKIDANVRAPVAPPADLFDQECGSLIPRGNGRSYGDSANAESVIQTTNMDRFISFDEQSGLIALESGVLLRDLLNFTVPRGWFLSVTPGTSLVTVGGAIAGDVHGKNHHIAGTFCQYVVSMQVMLASGEIVPVSETENPDLFRATCAGMGLTGLITTAKLQLRRVSSSKMVTTNIKSKSLAETMELFKEYEARSYSMAWIDCVKTGRKSGRSIFTIGEHAERGGLDINLSHMTEVPFRTPSFLVNRASMYVFNEIYYAVPRDRRKQTTDVRKFFFPLDLVADWNKFYGSRGLIQYQFVLPKHVGLNGLQLVLDRIHSSGVASPSLAVLKQLGPENDNHLSFPMEGYTLSMDFKRCDTSIWLVKNLDDMILELGGRLYLSKDGLMTDRTFKASYPNWEEFEAVREKYGAIGKFASHQSKRLGLG